jgi:hypothetical protein
LTYFVPFQRFWGDVRREFLHRLCVARHGTLDSYLRDALHEGSADGVAYLHSCTVQVLRICEPAGVSVFIFEFEIRECAARRVESHRAPSSCRYRTSVAAVLRVTVGVLLPVVREENKREVAD